MTKAVPNRDRAAGHRRGSTQVTIALAEVDFPTTKEVLEDRVGRREIEIEPGKELTLARMLDRVSQDRFREMTQVQALLDAKWREYVEMVRGEAPGPVEAGEKDETSRRGT